MKKYFSSLCILTVIVLFISACGSDKDKDIPESQLIPEWAKVAFVIKVNNVVADPYFNDKLNFIPELKKWNKELGQKAGIDLNKNLTSITVALSELFPASDKDNKKPDKQEADDKLPDRVIFFKGKYDEKKLLQYLEEKSKTNGEQIKKETISGFTVIEDKKSKTKTAFVYGKMIIVASTSKLENALELAQEEGKSILTNKKIAPYISTLKNNNLYWGFLDITPYIKEQMQDKYPRLLARGIPELNKIPEISKDLNTITFAGQKDKDNYTQIFNFECTNNKAAKEWTDVANSLLFKAKGFLSLMMPKLKTVVDKINVAQKEKNASVNFIFTKEDLKLLEKIFSEYEDKKTPIPTEDAKLKDSKDKKNPITTLKDFIPQKEKTITEPEKQGAEKKQPLGQDKQPEEKKEQPKN